MSFEYRTIPLERWVSDVDDQLDTYGKDGWDLIHIWNNVAYFKSDGLGNVQSGSFNMANDAFGRSRTSIPFTIGDYKHVYGINQSFLNDSGSGASITEDLNRASATLFVSGSGSYAIHQSRMYHNYMPGKSQYILNSFVFGATQSGIVKRDGYFDEYNGIYLEQDESGSLSWNIRSSTSGTGSISVNSVSQENWNVNTLLSGPNILDMSKTQLLFIDFQWLAVGRVRCGFVIKGIPIVTHVFDHSNITDVAYMSNPNLPVRGEIRALTNTTGSMESICGSVQSEGGYAESGYAFSHSNTSFRSLTSGSSLPVIAIKLKNSYNGKPNRSYVRISDFSAFTDQHTVRYALYKLPNTSSLTGGTWVSENVDSVVEYNVTATTASLTNAKELASGFLAANSLNPTQANPIAAGRSGVDNKANFIAQNIDSTNSEIYVVVVRNMTSSTTNVGGSILWKEIY